MVYGEMSEKIRKRRLNVLTFRQMKNTDFDQHNDRSDALWHAHVGDKFNSIDDQYDYWYALFESIAQDHAPLRGNGCPEPLVKTTEGDKRFVHLHCTTLRNTVRALGVN